jgi:hypothetical protein
MLKACKAEIDLMRLDANSEIETLVENIRSKEKEILNLKERFRLH